MPPTLTPLREGSADSDQKSGRDEKGENGHGDKNQAHLLGWVDDYHKYRSLQRDDVGLWVLGKAGGLFLTAFLITFGAPFRNDILSALTGIKKMALNK